jgi:hypothetical protein
MPCRSRDPASLHEWRFETLGFGGGKGGKRTGAVENLERLAIEELVAG